MKIGAIARIVVVVTVICAAGAAGWLELTPPRDRARGTPLNPHAFPRDRACEAVDLHDPVAAARARIAAGDLRPFGASSGFFFDVPGITCPADRPLHDNRGGAVGSDVADVCGGRYDFSPAPLEAMRAYNRTLAVDPQFRAITGCHVATYCEERYGKPWGTDARQRDPACPAEPAVLLAIARFGTPRALAEAIAELPRDDPATRALLTKALDRARLAPEQGNVRVLLRAGADPDADGKGRSPYDRR
jgi:hypothetical protein